MDAYSSFSDLQVILTLVKASPASNITNVKIDFEWNFFLEGARIDQTIKWEKRKAFYVWTVSVCEGINYGVSSLFFFTAKLIWREKLIGMKANDWKSTYLLRIAL